ncbi:MAG TPA: carbamoyltransferase HypF, partial [Gemmatimonadales bacterium]|nr:carbamoyltransferase HypF [Gemmatimonadales bacterium]
MTATGVDRAARLFAVSGVVQGVGFRPFVHRLAVRHGLVGWVRNTAGEVDVHVEGEPEAIGRFATALAAEAPPLARVARVVARDVAPAGFDAFDVLESADAPSAVPAIPPDVALCAACARELRDPEDRRAGYPFITCTDCGPRYTVVASLPYDRERTTMAAFTPCPACAAEYATPGDRRFHSETNSCPACGPRVWLEVAGVPVGADPLGAATKALGEGCIVAVRGMGGFHLAADATSEAAVRRLRERKRREAKPFAVMCASLEAAAALVHLDTASDALLASVERPIVLLPARAGSAIAPAVAPGLATLGVMLASTPLHRLLLEAVGRPLVMTSGNLVDEPIAASNDEARARLGGIADAFLLHDREIVARCDDSVLRPAPGGAVFLRRARGYAPLPIALPVATPRPLLAVGGQLKHTFALATGALAWPSPHQGDLDHLETLEHVRATLAHYRALFRVEPEVVAHDLHPGYLSTRLALETGLPLVGVQHHHAHMAAVLAEHGETGQAVGLSFDGTGCGEDGRIWGAETLVGDLASVRRVGQLRYAPLPGG